MLQPGNMESSKIFKCRGISRLRIFILLSFMLSAILSDFKVQGQAITSDSVSTQETSGKGVCPVKGRVYTQRDWYGYLVHKRFERQWAKVQYQITYPAKECCASLLIYYDDQVRRLKPEMSCEERVGVLPNDNNQVIPLRPGNDSNSGCSKWNENGEVFYVCIGERVFRSSVPRTWFFALARCNSSSSSDSTDETSDSPTTPGPLNLNYVFNITGYKDECEEDPLSPTSGWSPYAGHFGGDGLDGSSSSSREEVYRYLSISLGVLAGLALIVAAIFFALWLSGPRHGGKGQGKGGSVTSSQATMTQDDIFYVNPSLSERGGVGGGGVNSGGGDGSYGVGRALSGSGAGSENYYEVIPERRSYESINAGLAAGGNGGTLMLNGGGGLRLRSAGPPGAGVGGASTLGHHPAAHHHHPGMHMMHHHHHHQHNPNHHQFQPQQQPAPQQAQHMHVAQHGHVKSPSGTLSYIFEDYPPPPYQPPRVIGGAGPASGPAGMRGPAGGPAMMPTSSDAPGHSHTLSLPTSQRERPTLCHHAYHSSLVPTPAAMGGSMDDSSSNNFGMMGSCSSNFTNSTNNNIISSGSGGTSELSPAAMTTLQSLMASSSAGGGSSLAPLTTFGGGASSSNTSHLPSFAPPLSMSVTSSNSHVPAPAPSSGQSETSA